MAMIRMGSLWLGLALLSVGIWLGLLTLWGGFWRCDQQLDETQAEALAIVDRPTDQPPELPREWPTVCAVIPARNEADVLPQSLTSLLGQSYPGHFQMILVDDQSSDGTGAIAHQLAQEMGCPERLTVLSGAALPPGWTGKLWAMEQGVRRAEQLTPAPDYLLFTDADIAHEAGNLHRLAAKALQDDLDLVSLMVRLRCQSRWEQFLIPAFVFFFQKLYPFPLVNNPHSAIAAAAGGCILLRRTALEKIGGLQILRQALIDDCSLGIAVKQLRHTVSSSLPSKPNNLLQPTGKIWLGLTQTTISLRPYDSLQTIWDMVARTAYTQLNYSPLLLLGTVLGMALVYLVAPVALIAGVATAHWQIAIAGLLGWLLMAIAYWPTVHFYRLSPLWALSLPAIALLYNLMTIDSALRHWRGQGGAWKGRVYH
jgi:hopene-associated glycosyltransferase HpnB